MCASADLSITIIFMMVLSGVTSLDIEVFVNDSLSIRCSPNESTDIQWHHNSDFTYVYAGGKLRPPYNSRFLLKKDEKTGDYDLIIPKVTLEDAGRYYCSKEIDGRRINSTQLRVLYMKPTCSSNMPTNGFIGPNTCNIQQENMLFTCDVIFNGSSPHLSWRSANDSQVLNSTSCEVKSNRRSCSLTLSAVHSYDGSVFRCDVGQTKLDDRRYSCNTERIKVQYFFGDYAYEKKYVHETASCEVRSNLNVRYNWTLKQDNEEIFLTSKQTVSIEKQGLYQCGVKYSIRNVTCSLLVSDVNATVFIDRAEIQKEQSTILLKVILPIAVVVLVFALIGSIICIVKQRRLRRQEKYFPVRTDEPLTEKEIDAIERNRETLLELIDTSQLIHLLEKNGVFDKAKLDIISSKSTSREKNQALLEILRNGNLRSYWLTITCLRHANQSRAAEILETGGSVVRVDANLEMESMDVDRSEEEIALKINNLLRNQSNLQYSRIWKRVSKLRLIAAQKGRSVSLYFLCIKLNEVDHLEKMAIDGRLNEDIEVLFNKLIKTQKMMKITLRWASDVFVRCREVLQGSTRKCMKCSVQTVNARELPCEHVICPDCVQVLVKDNGRNYGIECPKCTSPFTVTVVPQERRQQEQNKYVKDEYNVEIKEDRSPLCLKSKVIGMAIMDNNIFVVCKEPPNIIFKFDLGASGGNEAVPVELLSISLMVWPRGIAASENHSCLYITDWKLMSGGKLWRYKYKRGEETRVNGPVALLDVQPFGVSVSPKNDEVLVTCATPLKVFNKRGWIYIYKPSGDEFQKVRTIELPNLEIPRHAILTASSQFIVCHGWSLVARHGVTSFEDGEDGALVAKRFYGRDGVGGGADVSEVNRPLSLTIDRNRMILVVDYYNNRIQLLTEDFQLVRHILTKKEHGIKYPRHVCQDPSTGRLYVGQEDGTVRIFN